jgi:hypothetical protein
MFSNAVTQSNSAWTNVSNIKDTRTRSRAPCAIEFPALGYGTPSKLEPSQSPSPIRVFANWHPISDEIRVVTPNEEMDMAFEDWEYQDEIELVGIHRDLKREYAKLKDYLLFMDPEEEYDIEFEHDDWYVPFNFGPKRDFNWDVRGLRGGRDWEERSDGCPISSMYPVMLGYGDHWC